MIDNKNCTGCGACSNVCPKGAIYMGLDKNGFMVPVIDSDKCMHCNLCENTCPRINLANANNTEQEFYAAYHKDVETRRASSSGGLFTAISDYVLEIGGVVVGVKQDNDLSAVMCIADSIEERNQFRKSKYVQCRTGNIYKEIKDILDSGRVVLFTGVPCQVTALRLFLRKSYENLYCIDILCHGSPSEDLFKEYIQEKEKKVRKKVKHYNFRDRHKTLGWKKTVFSIDYTDGSKEVVNSRLDNYWGLFYRNVAHRDSCYTCRHKTPARPGDITLGDFWGVEKHIPDIDTFNGVSLVVINTTKGKELFNNLSNSVDSICCDICDDLPQTMVENNPPYKYRKNFFSMRRHFGLATACFVHVFLFRVGMKLHLIKKNYR